MNIDTQDLPSYIAGYDDYIDDTRPVYSTREYNDMKEELESKIEDKEDEIYEQEEEIERLNNIINELEKELLEWHEFWEDNDEYHWQYKNAYDYLQELKGSDKE